jgi:hypothetical protein
MQTLLRNKCGKLANDFRVAETRKRDIDRSDHPTGSEVFDANNAFELLGAGLAECKGRVLVSGS